ncbi:MAG: EAL domain-containing protein [Halieaceae bacterium]
MRLTQRVNYILLPVILLVFTLAAILIYREIAQDSRQQLQGQIQREMNVVQQEVDLELRSLRAELSHILNSADFINFINAGSTLFQVYAFEPSTYALLATSRLNNPGIEELQILAPTGEAVLASSSGDPFGAPSRPGLPATVLEDYLRQVAAEQELVVREIVYQDLAGVTRFAVLQPVSPRLLVKDSQQSGSDIHVAVLVARLGAFDGLRERLQQQLGGEHELGFSLALDSAGSASADQFQATVTAGDLVFKQVHRLYSLELKVPEALLWSRLQGARLNLLLMVSALTVFSFLALRLLIQRQILRPVNELVQRVRESHHENIQLQRIDSNDEVSELNNAYVNLLQDIHHLASFDHLTGLANRRSFQLILARQLHSARNQSAQSALLFIDLDNFKRVNDQYGHATGDRLLQKFSDQLQESIRPEDVVASMGENVLARLAGDEFALLLNDTDGASGARIVAERILGMFDQGFEVDGVCHNINASIGIALAPEDGNHAQTLLRNADAAMYEAKANGKNRYQFFNRDIASVMSRRQKIEKVLDRALDSEHLHLVYMPIFETASLRPTGVEVLLRCPALAEQGIGPDEFIPVAESTGQIKRIDLWVLEEALLHLRCLRDEHGYQGFFAINISAVELHNEAFPQQVSELIARYGIDPALLELEITETSLVSDDADSIETLQALKALGLRLALDDFGTGYTAFNQLASYPVDTLKIDRSFVNAISDSSQQKRPMVDIILTLAELYDLHVIAEGVETAAELAYLQHSGCQQLQGYFLSMPLSWNALQQLVLEEQALLTEQREKGEHLKLVVD